MTKMTMIASNHHALYISCLVYGVGEVSIFLSNMVPTAMATANTINNVAVSLVEKRKLAIFFCIALGIFFAGAKIVLFADFNNVFNPSKSVKICQYSFNKFETIKDEIKS
jgi:hypothetical protein